MLHVKPEKLHARPKDKFAPDTYGVIEHVNGFYEVTEDGEVIMSEFPTEADAWNFIDDCCN